MKKLMITTVAVCMAALTQAASFNWSSSEAVYLVDAANVGDNGSYNAAVNKLTKSSAALTYVLSLYQGGELVGSANGSVGVSTSGNKFKVSGISIAEAIGGQTYDYVIEITGTQKALTEKASPAYDYTAAQISTTLSGQITAQMGAADLATGVPLSWTVSGVAAVPEPTSGLLLLLGVAGLALKRKRA